MARLLCTLMALVALVFLGLSMSHLLEDQFGVFHAVAITSTASIGVAEVINTVVSFTRSKPSNFVNTAFATVGVGIRDVGRCGGWRVAP